MEARHPDHEVAELLEEQRVTSEILRIIANSSTDPGPIFETVVANAARLCEANFAFVMLNEGGRLVLAARTDCTPEFAAFLQGGKPPNRATTTGRAALERRPVQVLDFLAEPEALVTQAHRTECVRTVLAVPMCREDRLLGVISVWRREVRPFSERQIRLLETFANQAVIAVENVRLFRELQAKNRELTEALEQQTATAEILRAISGSPSDALPVFQAIVRNAVALCGSLFANVFRFDGELLHYVASRNTGPGYVELLQSKYPMRPDLSQVSGRVLLGKAVVRLEDARSDPDYDQRFPTAMGWRRLLGVPMLRDGQPLGAIVVGWAEAGPIPKAQEELLKTFADQAVIAIENVRLFQELQARNRDITEALQQQTATAEVLKVISRSTFDLDPVLETLIDNAVRLCGSKHGHIFRFDGEFMRLAIPYGTSPEFRRYMEQNPPPLDPGTAVGRAGLERRVVHIADVLADADYRYGEAQKLLGYRTILAVPMLRGDVLMGAMAMWKTSVDPFTERQIDLVRTFADQAVIAIENVRLFEELQDKSRQLELASAYKSRFLAAASHDLRQPLHALNLFVAQLHAEADPAERERLVGRIDAAVGAMNELFNSLLDMSKLEAGMLEAELTEFPVERLLKHMETTFAGAAGEKGLRLSVVPSAAWVRSDFILLERILLNLVSNAVRYTTRGGIVIGCRRRGARLRLEVWDSGPGIPEDHRQSIFREFYQLAGPGRDRRGGLGLGLAIVDGLGRLLDHPVELKSRPGRGSCFSVSVPRAAAQQEAPEAPVERARPADPLSGKLVVVIDDDALVLDGMRGILRSWGCGVVTEPSAAEALARLTELGSKPDVIISDYRLANGKTGIEAIERLRSALGEAIPAFLMSGDTAPERLRDAGASGYHLLHKPVPPMALRAMLNGILRSRDDRAPFRAALREASRRSSAARAPARRPR
jgi:signal transduction histidine kinase/CheY-like chemotaxis protein